MSRRLRLLLMGVALIVIIAVVWVTLLAPLRSELAETSAQIEEARSEMAVAQSKLAQAEVTRIEGTKNRARLIELAKMLPQEEQIPSLLIQIQDLAVRSGIDFMSITPGSPEEGDEYNITPLAVEFTGTFFNISDFVYRAEQMVAAPGRLLAVKTISLELATSASTTETTATTTAEGSAKTGPSLQVSMTLYAFTAGGSDASDSTNQTAPGSSENEESSTTTSTSGS